MSCVIRAGIALTIELSIFSRRNLKFGTNIYTNTITYKMENLTQF